VLAFDPNPLAILRPDALPPRLTSFEQRARFLKRLGADEVIRLVPTKEFLQQDAETFIAECVRKWRPTAIVEGADFRFGRGRAGSIDMLRGFGAQHGFQTIVVDQVEVVLADQSVVRASSSLVRWLLAHGRVRDATILLGRPYEIEGVIVSGDRRGRAIGFPTANLDASDQLLPGDGIYTGVAWRDDRQWPAAISVGIKPTFGQHPRVCEAHLLDYDGPIDDYGWTIRLTFTHWLRDQLTFANVEALIEQLHRDIAQTRDLTPESPRIVGCALDCGTAVPAIS
jgi:riboflavin kinase/FMN adenylyltransferase